MNLYKVQVQSWINNMHTAIFTGNDDWFSLGYTPYFALVSKYYQKSSGEAKQYVVETASNYLAQIHTYLIKLTQNHVSYKTYHMWFTFPLND